MGHYIAEWINGIDSEELRFLRRIATPPHPAGTLTYIGATARLMWRFNAKSEMSKAQHVFWAAVCRPPAPGGRAGRVPALAVGAGHTPSPLMQFVFGVCFPTMPLFDPHIGPERQKQRNCETASSPRSVMEFIRPRPARLSALFPIASRPVHLLSVRSGPFTPLPGKSSATA